MLSHLLIKNYALIEQLELHPHEAFNIITGETGAGKSIMLGAIGLLLGNRADLKVLYNQDEKCLIEGTFQVKDYDLSDFFQENDLDPAEQVIIRREIAPGGKSRAFINDTPVNLDVLKLITSKLIDIHSQHDNLLLGNNLFQLQVVDAFAETKPTLTQYRALFTKYKLLKNHHQQIQAEYQAAQKELEFNQFQLQELAQAKFEPDEQEKLEAEEKLLTNTEDIKSRLHIAAQVLSLDENAVNTQLRVALQAFNQLANYAAEYDKLRERLESAFIELKDLAAETESEAERVEFNPERLLEVQDRLSLVYRLQKKYGVSSIQELLQMQEELTQKVQRVLNFDDDLSKAAIALSQAHQEMQGVVEQLSQKRVAILPALEEALKVILIDLGMPNATLRFTAQVIEPNTEGIDFINFLFSANKGIEPQEIEKVASGGEFSRLMLAIKSILASKTAMPTVIFDEIDTGISGEIALKMGKILKDMSKNHQIIAISHLHQIAAKGDLHYFVFKDDSADRTVSRIKQLTTEERVFTIAQMISGSEPTESAITSALELLGS